MQAILVDCRTGMILGTATGDGRDKKLCPAAFVGIRKAQMARDVGAEALADLQTGVRRLAARVVTAALAKTR